MRSYLSLVPISAKVRRRQNRMTIICIIISVLLVTTIFSVADMIGRAENTIMQDKHGSWHIQIENISQDTAEEISSRSDVTALGWSEVFNSDAEQPYYVGGKKAALCGADSIYLSRLANALEEGDLPQTDHEIMLSSNAKFALDVEIGDHVIIQTPSGDTDFTVCGFGSNDKEYYRGQTYLIAVYLTRAAFASLMEQNNVPLNPICYVQFQNASKASRAISEIREQYALPDGSISENTAIMGISGRSGNASMKGIYEVAAVLFILVLLAGILMISSSMNSNVAQRTKFFGMMRCIGASQRQIVRFVRLEALNWCKTAIPVGLILGVIISCGVCTVLHYGVGGVFAAAPVFALSPIGLISGAVVGIATVLLSARSPARHASRVTPMAAVSGNSEISFSARHTARMSFGKIERTLGVHHATSSRKNWFLMTASFSLSIILLLCFSVGLDFVHELLPSLRSYQPDITLNGYENALLLDQELSDAISSISGVDHVFGASYLENIPAVSSRQGVDSVNLVSYSDYLLDSAEDSLMQGDLSAIYGDSDQVMTISNKDNPLKVGDTVEIYGNKVRITCAVTSGLYPSEYSIICSQETLERLTGEKNYSLIGVQLGKDADDETIRQINNLIDNDVIFTDLRVGNQDDATTYIAAKFTMYCFLAVIAMITLFNIINSISMSVTARIKQYGAMRAVGMDGGQVSRMIAAEAVTYVISGLAVGGCIGIALSRLLYIRLITKYFGTAWNPPMLLLGIIVVFGFISVIAAAYAPSKRIRNMAVTDTINEL